VLHWERQAA